MAGSATHTDAHGAGDAPAAGTGADSQTGGGEAHSKKKRKKRSFFGAIGNVVFGIPYRWFQRHSISITLIILLLLLGVGLLAPRIFITIPAGHVGVLWERFGQGTDTDNHHTEGVVLILPWNEMYIYDARLQNDARTYDTISSNGLNLEVEIATRYRINQENIGLLHKLVGPRYPEILVYPEIGSHARNIISRYTPEQLYSDIRSFIQAQILERMVTELGASLVNQSVRGRLIEVEDVLIRSVVLPDTVRKAIERKAEQYQAMLEYEFRLERERKERERKFIEAEGIAAFQQEVAGSITNEYLRLRGIEATIALSTSRNSKTVIIGGQDGLPLILNTGDSPGGGVGSTNASTMGPLAPGQQAQGADFRGAEGNPALSRSPHNARFDDPVPNNALTPGIFESDTISTPHTPGSGTPRPSTTSVSGSGQSSSATGLAPSGDGPAAPSEAPMAPNESTGMAPSERATSAGSGLNETPATQQGRPAVSGANTGAAAPVSGTRASGTSTQ